MTPSPYLFGLSNAAVTYASAHAEPPGRNQRSALDLIVTTPTHTHADSSEEDEAWAGVDFSALHDPEAVCRFMATSDYCFGYSDSDDEGTYDLPLVSASMSSLGCREQAMRTKGQAIAPRQVWGQAMPHHHAPSPRQRGTMSPPPRNFDA